MGFQTGNAGISAALGVERGQAETQHLRLSLAAHVHLCLLLMWMALPSGGCSDGLFSHLSLRGRGGQAPSDLAH